MQFRACALGCRHLRPAGNIPEDRHGQVDGCGVHWQTAPPSPWGHGVFTFFGNIDSIACTGGDRGGGSVTSDSTKWVGGAAGRQSVQPCGDRRGGSVAATLAGRHVSEQDLGCWKIFGFSFTRLCRISHMSLSSRTCLFLHACFAFHVCVGIQTYTLLATK